jgi:hypothetical protein
LGYHTPNFGETYGIVEKTYQSTTWKNFRLIRAEIAYIHQKEGWLEGQTPNRGFKGMFT